MHFLLPSWERLLIQDNYDILEKIHTRNQITTLTKADSKYLKTRYFLQFPDYLVGEFESSSDSAS